MGITVSREALESAYQQALAALLAERHPDGYWVGELSTSALSTATAVSALSLVQKHIGTKAHQHLIDNGIAWLVAHQNNDGGWGDTVKSFSNISTTMLCRAAFHLAGASSSDALRRAEAWLFERYGKTPEELSEAVRKRYGKDRTFAVPILTTCALAGLVPWREVPSLPFELACFPMWMFRFLRLHVVSYALPALIAIGQCVYYHKPPWNPFARFVRWLAKKKSLRVLERIQPSNGGFLEATPLTSFVTLSLAASGLAEHIVTRKGVDFLVKSVRPDGSWPIDTNLSTWVTTLAVNALAGAGELSNISQSLQLYDWLRLQQHMDVHPYTDADPGGFAWTPLPGGVPDADDTPGAIIALCQVERQLGELEVSKNWHRWGHARGWLLGLQNDDGGWPTFCRGWGSLPFDRSGTDLTAHANRAFKELSVVKGTFDIQYFNRLYGQAVGRGFSFLARSQRPDGSWLPLWFGNQHAHDDENPTYGTARVLAAYRDLDVMNTEPARRGVAWLLASQNDDGGWGGTKGCPSSVEETALAVEILVDAGSEAEAALNRGLAWLIDQVEQGGLDNPTPIGFYFAKLWYFEKLYPIIFTVAALGRARRRPQ
jgi:squalene-hopene/tetraprenyl-beta-curcumene cyclase